MAQHKWHKEIKAWADGALIEKRKESSEWLIAVCPRWEIHEDTEYRIKPQPKEPQYIYAYYGNDCSNGYHAFWDERHSNHIDMRGRGYRYIGKIKLENDDDM